jgi:2-iminobutanoate/2-iminopropanoate deaminase
VEVAAGSRIVFCSGQLGIGADGVIPDDVESQARLCFRAIAAILSEASMSLADLVRLNAYVSSAQHLGGYMKVRDEFVSSPPPASTLMIVQGFARPEFKVEVEAVAARAA